MRLLPVNLDAILVELADLDETLALFDALEADPIEGVTELVPAARTTPSRTSRSIRAATCSASCSTAPGSRRDTSVPSGV